MWHVLVTDVYEEWFLSLSDAEQIEIQALVEVLEIKGPSLSRPYADVVHGTRVMKNLKELRIQHKGKPYRVFYAFDPLRRAILLCGGTKVGRSSKHFYQKMMADAERLFHEHLANLANVGSKNG